MLVLRFGCGDADDYADASLLNAEAVELQMLMRRRCQSDAVACVTAMRCDADAAFVADVFADVDETLIKTPFFSVAARC